MYYNEYLSFKLVLFLGRKLSRRLRNPAFFAQKISSFIEKNCKIDHPIDRHGPVKSGGWKASWLYRLPQIYGNSPYPWLPPY